MTAAGERGNDRAPNEHAASSGARDPWRDARPGPARAGSEADPSAEAVPSREQRKAGESDPFGGGPDGTGPDGTGPDGTGPDGRDEPEAV